MNTYGDYDYSHHISANMVDSIQEEWSDDPAFLPSSLTYATAFVVGVVGNAMVVFSMLFDRKSRNVTSSLLVSLAVADLVFLLVFVPYEAAIKMATNWVGGVVLCKVSGFAEMLSAVASILNLTAVTAERYVVIVHPMKARSWCTVGSAQKIVVGVWCLAVLLSCPMLYVMDTTTYLFYNNDTRITRETCADENLQNEERLVFAWYQLVVMFLVPTVVLIYCYAVVIKVLWLSTKELERMTSTGDALLTETEEDRKRTFGPRSRTGRTIIRRTAKDHSAEVQHARKQVIKMLLTILAIFLLCWGPKLILNILKRHELSILHRDEAFWITVTINLLPYVQSAVNPIIYGFMSKNFRRGLRATLRTCCWCRCCRLVVSDGDAETKSISMNGTYVSARHNPTSVTAVSEF